MRVALCGYVTYCILPVEIEEEREGEEREREKEKEYGEVE